MWSLVRRARPVLVVAAVVVAAVVLVWFQPQKLFYDQRVDEALPVVAAPAPTSAPAPAPAPAPAVPAESVPSPEPVLTALPVPPVPAGPVELASGTFVSREHETSGTVRVLRLPDGSLTVRLEGFATSNGPQLVVGLSRNRADGPDDSFDDGDFTDLGPLKGNVGDQNYSVPAGVDAAGFTSVVIWCDRFDASFGAADLVPST